jgi:hypothetical protein
METCSGRDLNETSSMVHGQKSNRTKSNKVGSLKKSTGQKFNLAGGIPRKKKNMEIFASCAMA